MREFKFAHRQLKNLETKASAELKRAYRLA